MSDDTRNDDTRNDDRTNDETQPVRAEGAPADAPAPEAAGSGRRGFRERLRALRRSEDGSRTFGLAALIASALAGIIVGGLGAATFHAVTHDGPGERPGWVHRRDMGGEGDFGRHGPMERGPHGVPGLVPPSIAPEDDGSDS